MKKMLFGAACAAVLSASVFAEKGPVYISPNNDGVQDALEVPMKIRDNRYVVEWTFVVTDENGNVVRTIGNKEKHEDKVTFKNFFRSLVSSKKNVDIPPSVVWNGIMDNGQVAPDGTYYYTVSATDDSGNSARTSPLVVIVDNTPPEVILTPLADSEKIFGEGARATVRVQQTGSEEDLWTGVLTNNAGTVVRTFTWKNSAPLPFEWGGTDDKGAPLPDGVYTYRISATDRAGNVSAPASLTNLVYTAEKPVLGIAINGSRYFSPTGNASKSVQFDVSVPIPHAASGNRLTGWTVTVIDADGKECWKQTGTENPPSSFSFDGKGADGRLLADGSYQARVTAEYLNGYEPKPVASPVFMLDTKAPAATLTTSGTIFSPDGDGNQDTLTITQQFAEDDGSPVTNWVGTIADVRGNAVRTYHFGAYPPETVSWDGLNDGARMATDGDYVYTLSATDAAGNAATVTSKKFTLDMSNTEVMLTANYPAFNPDGARSTIRLTPVMKEGTAVNHYVLSIVDSQSREVYREEADRALPAAFTWNGIGSDGARCADDTYTAILETKSTNGSEAGAMSQPFAIDTVPPKIDARAAYSLFSPDGDGERDSLPVQVAESTDDIWTGTVVNERGNVVRTFDWQGTVPSFEWDGTDDAGNKVADGTYTLAFNAEDAAGNRTTTELGTFTVDKRPTAVYVTAELDAFSPNGDGDRDTQQFTIRSSLNEGIATWKFDIASVDGTVVRSWTNADSPTLPPTITWDGTDDAKHIVADGVYVGVLSIVYEKGNAVNTTSSAFISTVTPPQLSVQTLTESGSGYFSPDNDGTDDDLFIRLKAVSPVGLKNWSFTINDPNGRPFWSTGGKSAITEQMVWDGRGSNGELVQSAMDYPYVFTATDTLGMTSTVEGSINIDILVIRVGDVLKMAVPAIIFRSDAADFKVESAPGKNDGVTREQAANNERVLDRVATILNKFDTYKVTVVGHANRTTDDSREETTDDPAWGRALTPLSKERAEYVKSYLTKRKVRANRLDTEGKGGTEPVTNPMDEANRWKNRRVEFILNK